MAKLAPPDRLFHVSRSPEEIGIFQPFTHFGTYEAATARAANSICAEAEVLRIYEVSLRAERPLTMSDLPGQTSTGVHSIIKIADALHYRRGKVLTSDERSSVLAAGYPDRNELAPGPWDESAASRRLAEVLMGKGYDAIAYANAYEDVGSMSWMILSLATVSIHSVDIYEPDGAKPGLKP